MSPPATTRVAVFFSGPCSPFRPGHVHAATDVTNALPTVFNMSYMPINSPRSGSATLVDVLDRVLEKGLVVAGDIEVSLADIELLTIRIRLVLCSIEKAEQKIGRAHV